MNHIMNQQSGAYPDLKKIVTGYSSIFPSSTYPFFMLSISSCCVFFHGLVEIIYFIVFRF